jgi:hypothetical protein
VRRRGESLTGKSIIRRNRRGVIENSQERQVLPEVL